MNAICYSINNCQQNKKYFWVYIYITNPFYHEKHRKGRFRPLRCFSYVIYHYLLNTYLSSRLNASSTRDKGNARFILI